MSKNKEVQPNEVTKKDDPIFLGDEPDTSRSLAATIQLLKAKGCIDKDKSNKRKPVIVISESKRAKLEAQSVTIEDKKDDNSQRRGRNHNQLKEVRERTDYKPEITLEYTDDAGRKLEHPKEAFRLLCHKFHGVGPGKNKIDKRNKKREVEDQLKSSIR